MNRMDVTGLRFGRLLVIAGAGRFCWCVCDCGNERILRRGDLRRGDTTSCGCCRRERCKAMGRSRAKHGHTASIHGRDTATYRSWRSMHQRCSDPRRKDYAGRGITVCERWAGPAGFQNFLADMGERQPGTTLDRYPNGDGNYEPGNVRWATPEQQARNKRQTQHGELGRFVSKEKAA